MYRCQKLSFQQFILCNDILRTVAVMRFYIINEVQINFIIFPRMKRTIMFLFAYTLCKIIPVYVHNKKKHLEHFKVSSYFYKKKLSNLEVLFLFGYLFLVSTHTFNLKIWVFLLFLLFFFYLESSHSVRHYTYFYRYISTYRKFIKVMDLLL